MKKILLIFILMAITSQVAKSQPYVHSVGIKAGYSSGFAYKLFLDRQFALDAQALYNVHGFQFTAMYDFQYSPYDKKRLYYYFGAGLHTGNWDEEFALGAAAVAGTEFVFWKAPIIIGAEWKPMVNVVKTFGYAPADFAIIFKVVLK